MSASSPDLLQQYLYAAPMSAAEASAAEARLVGDASEAELRARLPSHWAQLEPQPGQRAQLRHVLWLVEHAPGDPVCTLPVFRGDPREGRPEHDLQWADRRHVGETVLGLLRPAQGDEVGAEQALLASADVPTSGVLGSYGPRLSLARALLARGRREPVQRFLIACRRFWQDAEELEAWIAALDAGAVPDWDDLVDGP